MWEAPAKDIQRLVIKAERLGYAIIRNEDERAELGLPFSLIDQTLQRVAEGPVTKLEQYLHDVVANRTLH